MKKFLLTFILFLIFISSNSYAQTEIPIASITPTQSPSKGPVQYELPYPGVLPGALLYNLKAVRDRIIEFLMSDPSKKSNFYLLQADKRLSASIMLFDRGKNVLAETTLSKSQNYLEKAIDKAEKVSNLKGRFGEANDRIKLSSAKQIEELEKLIKENKGETNQKLKGDLKRAKELQKRAEKLR